MRDWTPVKSGEIYCSPACGGKCTKGEFDKAHRAAKALCKKMDTKGWKPRVWENLGWHWSIVKGGLTVWGGSKDYLVGFEGGTPCEVSVGKSFKDPNRAVEAQKELIKAVAKKWLNVLKEVADV